MKHKIDLLISGGLQMCVIDASNHQAKIGYFDKDGVHMEAWVDLNDLEVIKKNEGGFFNNWINAN